MLSVDRHGFCDFCRRHAERWGPGRAPTDGRQRLDAAVLWAATRNGGYDALVPVSGGKDSLTVLDFMRNEYPRLRILAATLDNGFFSDHAMELCRKVTAAVGVEHVVWRIPHGVRLAKLFLTRTGHLCCPCQVGLMNMYHGLATRHRIPLVVLGTSRRHDGAHPEAANPWTPPFFEAVLAEEPGADSLREGACERGLLWKFGVATLAGRTRTVLLPDHVEWDVAANRARLESRYGVELGADHADCLAGPVADWIYKRRCGFGQKSATIAAAVRNGKLGREEALQRLDGLDEFGAGFPAEEASVFLERVGMSADEVAACAALSPRPYFGMTFRAIGLARRVMGLSIA
jgi:hypothetical protein